MDKNNIPSEIKDHFSPGSEEKKAEQLPSKRFPLKCPTEIKTKNHQCFIIDNVYCEGGSSIIYEAHTVNNFGKNFPVLIKEFYPFDLRNSLKREGDKLVLINDQHKRIYGTKLASSEYEILDEIVYGDKRKGWDSDFLNGIDHFEANNTCYTVLERAKGKTLSDYVQEGSKRKDRIWICRVIEHLIYLEKKIVSKGYLHMDISPDNIFISGLDPQDKNIPYLIDYNSALCPQERENLTSDKISDKIGYTAPEIQEIAKVSNDDAFQKAANPHADIYSLTAVFYTLLVGSAPNRPITSNDRDVYPVDNEDDEKKQIKQKLNAFLKNGLNEDPNQRFDEDPIKALDKMYEKMMDIIGSMDPRVQDEIKKRREAEKKAREAKIDKRRQTLLIVFIVMLLIFAIPYLINPYKDYKVYFRNDGETEWISAERFQSPVVGSTIECKVCQKGLPSDKNVSIRLVLDDALKYDSFHSVTISPGDEDESKGTSIRSDIFSESYRVDDFIQNGKVCFYFDAIVLEEKDSYSVKTVVEDAHVTETTATGSWWDNSASGEGRPSYTIDEINNGVLGDTIVLNSISDSVIGDEKNFVGARKSTQNRNGQFLNAEFNGNEIEAENGQTYFVRLYVHNNSPYPDHVAKDIQVSFTTDARAEQLSDNDYSQKIWGWISSSNASPSEYADSVAFYSEHPFHLEYQKGSALLENNGIGANGGYQLNDSIWGSWTTIGYEQLDGNIPGCYQYAAYVGIKVKVVFDDTYEDTHKNPVFYSEFRIQSQIKDTWLENDYQLHSIDQLIYKSDQLNCCLYGINTFDNDLKFKVQVFLPDAFKYVENSTDLFNANHPDGIALDDTTKYTICSDGINVGSYTQGANFCIKFNIIPQEIIEEGQTFTVWVKTTGYNDSISVSEWQKINITKVQTTDTDIIQYYVGG